MEEKLLKNTSKPSIRDIPEIKWGRGGLTRSRRRIWSRESARCLRLCTPRARRRADRSHTTSHLRAVVTSDLAHRSIPGNQAVVMSICKKCLCTHGGRGWSGRQRAARVLAAAGVGLRASPRADAAPGGRFLEVARATTLPRHESPKKAARSGVAERAACLERGGCPLAALHVVAVEIGISEDLAVRIHGRGEQDGQRQQQRRLEAHHLKLTVLCRDGQRQQAD